MEDEFKRLSSKYGVSRGVVETLYHALRLTGGRQAQFNIPELGGLGQWMPGMVMVGDMFNTGLKATVDGLCSELSGSAAANAYPNGMGGVPPVQDWWPVKLGKPSARGGQNDLEYAYFPAKSRVAVRYRGAVAVYDTSGYEVRGVYQQQQPGFQSVVLDTQRGPVEVARLRRVE